MMIVPYHPYNFENIDDLTGLDARSGHLTPESLLITEMSRGSWNGQEKIKNAGPDFSLTFPSWYHASNLPISNV